VTFEWSPRLAAKFSTPAKERPRRFETRPFSLALDDEGFEFGSVNFNGHGRCLLLSGYREAAYVGATSPKDLLKNNHFRSVAGSRSSIRHGIYRAGG
jgi:hypothetical protein